MIEFSLFHTLTERETPRRGSQFFVTGYPRETILCRDVVESGARDVKKLSHAGKLFTSLTPLQDHRQGSANVLGPI